MPSHSKHGITINNKQNSSVLKIKQKNKRRNHKKRKQKTQYPIHENQMSNITNLTCSKHNVDNATDTSSATRNQMAVAQMWAKSYETMIRLQFQHQIQYWKNLAINRNTEICRLRKNLRKQNQNNCKNIEDEASVKSSNQEDLVSESYLKFLEITLRHRQERKHNRALSSSDKDSHDTDSD